MSFIKNIVNGVVAMIRKHEKYEFNHNLNFNGLSYQTVLPFADKATAIIIEEQRKFDFFIEYEIYKLIKMYVSSLAYRPEELEKELMSDGYSIHKLLENTYYDEDEFPELEDAVSHLVEQEVQRFFKEEKTQVFKVEIKMVNTELESVVVEQ